MLSELRDRLRAGDVWVVGSRRYRSFEERLISREILQELLQSGTPPVAVDPDFERFIADRRALLDARLTAIDAKAKDGMLPDVSIDKGVLKISADRKVDAAGGETLAAPPLRHAAAHPHHRPAVGGGALDAVHRLLHPSRGPAKRPPTRVLMAGLLADGLNLGLTRMAEACSDRQPRPARLDG